MERIGWIGLGTMGSRMLPHIMEAGYPTTIYARNETAAGPHVAAGAAAARSPAELAGASDIVFTILAMPDDVESVYFGSSGLLAGSRAGSVLVDMTTSSPELARRIVEAAREREVDALDAPVSGGPAGAETAALSIMVGGDLGVIERVGPLLRLLGSTIVHQGPAGAGQGAKMANQLAVGGAMLGICEAFLFARSAGLDSDKVFETLSSGIAGSGLIRYAWPRLASDDLEPGFRVEHMIKDLGLALDAGHEATIALPGAALVKELYHAVRAAGYSGKGTQALIKAIDHSSTASVPK